MTSKQALSDLYFLAIGEETHTTKCKETIEKDLKILDIIKKHKLLNYVLKNEKCANMYHLSKEEIDLLREIEK